MCSCTLRFHSERWAQNWGRVRAQTYFPTTAPLGARNSEPLLYTRSPTFLQKAVLTSQSCMKTSCQQGPLHTRSKSYRETPQTRSGGRRSKHSRRCSQEVVRTQERVWTLNSESWVCTLSSLLINWVTSGNGGRPVNPLEPLCPIPTQIGGMQGADCAPQGVTHVICAKRRPGQACPDRAGTTEEPWPVSQQRGIPLSSNLPPVPPTGKTYRIQVPGSRALEERGRTGAPRWAFQLI